MISPKKCYTTFLVLFGLMFLTLVACTESKELDEINCTSTPVLTTGTITDLTGTSVTLNGTVEDSTCDSNIISQGFVYSINELPKTTDMVVEVDGNVITKEINDLEPNTIYYYRAFYTTTTGTVYGKELSFTTNSGFIVDYTDFQGDINEGTVTLDASLTYNLTGALVVNEGAVLVIPAGTRIEATRDRSAYIAVARGAKIYINGTSTNPVVMTSGRTEKRRKDWGGLVICGDAVTNVGEGAISEAGGLVYGGANNADSSGVIRYLRVEYTGAAFSSRNEFNGVSLFAVGSETVFENVSSVNGGDDGIEFFGGAVNAKNLVSINSGDDSFDFSDGFTGSVDGLYIKGVTKAGIEGSNNGADGNLEPITTATISNVSIVVDGLGASEGAIYFKEGGGNITYENLYVDGVFLGVKVKSSDEAAKRRVGAGDLEVNQIQFVNNTVDFILGQEGAEETITEGNNDGAGNGADLPVWALGWAI